MSAAVVYHVELRQHPHVARAFNLTRAQLDERILVPWMSRASFHFEDREWIPEEATLVIYEAPHLEIAQLGLGRGWGEVTRSGRDVTDELVHAVQASTATPADEATEWLKAEIVQRARRAPLTLHQVVELAHVRYRGWRASDRLAVAERAVWELLHLQEVRLTVSDVAVDPSGWEAIVLDWDVWTGAARTQPTLVP